jgi:hypothetical protein
MTNAYIVNSYCCGISGEWFNVDPEAVINQALQTGGGPNVSDAYTINGLPGPFYNCSSKGIKTSMYNSSIYNLLDISKVC